MQAANAGSYTVLVSNSFGAVTSAAATLTVTPGAVTPQTPAGVGGGAQSRRRRPRRVQKALLVFSRTGDTTAPLTVNYTVKGSAQANVDYKALSGHGDVQAGSGDGEAQGQGG